VTDPPGRKARQRLCRFPAYRQFDGEVVLFVSAEVGLGIGCVDHIEIHSRGVHVCLRQQPTDAPVARVLTAVLQHFRIGQQHPAFVKRHRLLAKPEFRDPQRESIGAVDQM
jgi:hypothetical protein